MGEALRPLYVSGLELENIKCIAKLSLQFDDGGDAPWAVMVGDNATGKTVVLRSLALGLCDQTSAAGLMKESDEGYIRRPEKKGSIVVDLRDPDSPGTTYRITTVLTKEGSKKRPFERLSQVTKPRNFPWERIFACAYGLGRTSSGTGDIPEYSVLNAVYNLFSYGEGLQNPELFFRRLPNEKAQQLWLDHLATVLPVRKSGIHLADRGLTFDGPWGDDMPFRDLADGIRGTFLWTADLIGWAIANNSSIESPEMISGVVLIDEIEQQLHATWQRNLVDILQTLFPCVQFIATTHSPLIASSVGPTIGGKNNNRLFVLEAGPDRHVEVSRHEFMRGWGMDQVLASRAFKYQIEGEPATERILRFASMLGDKEHRTDEEEDLFQDVKNTLKGAFLEGKSSVERLAEIEANDDLRRRVEEMLGRQRPDDSD